jgi:hypothetical protein
VFAAKVMNKASNKPTRSSNLQGFRSLCVQGFSTTMHKISNATNTRVHKLHSTTVQKLQCTRVHSAQEYKSSGIVVEACKQGMLTYQCLPLQDPSTLTRRLTLAEGLLAGLQPMATLPATQVDNKMKLLVEAPAAVEEALASLAIADSNDSNVGAPTSAILRVMPNSHEWGCRHTFCDKRLCDAMLHTENLLTSAL